MESLEQIKYQAALSITGCWQRTSLNKIYEELGWETMFDRRWTRRLTHFFKIFCNDSLPYLKERVPLPRNALYCFQRPNTLNEVKCRTSKYMNRLGIILTRIFETVIPLTNIKERFFLLYVQAKDPFSGFTILVELNTFSNVGWV